MGRMRIAFCALLLLALGCAVGLEAAPTWSNNDPVTFLTYGASAGTLPTSAQVVQVATWGQHKDIWGKEASHVTSTIRDLTQADPVVIAQVAFGAPSPDTVVHVHSYSVDGLRALLRKSGSPREPKFGFAIDVTPAKTDNGRQTFPSGLVIMLQVPPSSNPFLLFKTSDRNYILSLPGNNGKHVENEQFVGDIQLLQDGWWQVTVQSWVPGDPCCGGG